VGRLLIRSDDDDVYLYKSQTRVSKNLNQMFPYKSARKP
jgi:hypothetical protein